MRGRHGKLPNHDPGSKGSDAAPETTRKRCERTTDEGGRHRQATKLHLQDEEGSDLWKEKRRSNVDRMWEETELTFGASRAHRLDPDGHAAVPRTCGRTT